MRMKDFYSKPPIHICPLNFSETRKHHRPETSKRMQMPLQKSVTDQHLTGAEWVKFHLKESWSLCLG